MLIGRRRHLTGKPSVFVVVDPVQYMGGVLCEKKVTFGWQNSNEHYQNLLESRGFLEWLGLGVPTFTVERESVYPEYFNRFISQWHLRYGSRDAKCIQKKRCHKLKKWVVRGVVYHFFIIVLVKKNVELKENKYDIENMLY